MTLTTQEEGPPLHLCRRRRSTLSLLCCSRRGFNEYFCRRKATNCGRFTFWLRSIRFLRAIFSVSCSSSLPFSNRGLNRIGLSGKVGKCQTNDLRSRTKSGPPPSRFQDPDPRRLRRDFRDKQRLMGLVLCTLGRSTPGLRNQRRFRSRQLRIPLTIRFTRWHH